MHRHELPHDAEADPEAPTRRSRRLIELREHVEDARQGIGRDADAVVRHADDDRAALRPGVEAKVAPFFGVLDRIVEEVGQYLGEPREVRLQEHRLFGEIDHEVAARGVHGRPHGLEGVFHDRGQGDPLLAQLDLATADAAQVEEVVDEPHHLPKLPFHDVAGLRPCPCVALSREPHDLEGVAEGAERAAQLVGEGGQELVLVTVGLPQGLLDADALGDVDGDAPDQARATEHGRDRKLADQGVVHAVLVLQGLDRLHGGLAGECACVVVAELRGRNRRKDLVVRVTEDLRVEPTEGTRRRRVDEQVAAAGVLDPGQARQVVHEPSEAMLALSQGRSLPAVRLVGKGLGQPDRDPGGDQSEPGAMTIVESHFRVEARQEDPEPLRS